MSRSVERAPSAAITSRHEPVGPSGVSTVRRAPSCAVDADLVLPRSRSHRECRPGLTRSSPFGMLQIDEFGLCARLGQQTNENTDRRRDSAAERPGDARARAPRQPRGGRRSRACAWHSRCRASPRRCDLHHRGSRSARRATRDRSPPSAPPARRRPRSPDGARRRAHPGRASARSRSGRGSCARRACVLVARRRRAGKGAVRVGAAKRST